MPGTGFLNSVSLKKGLVLAPPQPVVVLPGPAAIYWGVVPVVIQPTD
jgi:hypothetical protein